MNKSVCLKFVRVSLSYFCVAASVFLLVQGSYFESAMCLLAGVSLFVLPYIFETFSLRASFLTELLGLWVIFGSLVLGEGLRLYEKIPIWDDQLHFLSGALFCLCGCAFFKASNTALGAFSFSVMLNAVWEVVEFALDRIFGTNMQKDRPIKAPVFGQATAGSGMDIGLYDTMTDLIVGSCGALVILFLWLGARDAFAHAAFPEVKRKEQKREA